MVNKPLIRPYFWGGYVSEGLVDQSFPRNESLWLRDVGKNISGACGFSSGRIRLGKKLSHPKKMSVSKNAHGLNLEWHRTWNHMDVMYIYMYTYMYIRIYILYIVSIIIHLVDLLGIPSITHSVCIYARCLDKLDVWLVSYFNKIRVNCISNFRLPPIWTEKTRRKKQLFFKRQN